MTKGDPYIAETQQMSIRKFTLLTSVVLICFVLIAFPNSDLFAFGGGPPRPMGPPDPPPTPINIGVELIFIFIAIGFGIKKIIDLRRSKSTSL